jgi:anaerobic magnesium-protoporphyrin IX monomethyl ester cyclase
MDAKRMRILLVNPPYLTITSTLGVGHQVPLGLLMVGGALIDAGHAVALLDAEALHLEDGEIAARAADFAPDVVMTGHAGSTPAHPVCVRTLGLLRAALPGVRTVYGGVYPTYHATEILRDAPWIDAIVRGAGEAPAVALVAALARGEDPSRVPGVAARRDGQPCVAADSPLPRNLDALRTGWELIADWDLYQCFGVGRAAIVQFSRGCPHRCSYCGQFQFWVSWRHRTPRLLADEIEWLCRRHAVRFVTLADENPTTSPRLWAELLSELASRHLPVQLFATIRASDVVRDAGLLPLYRQAGLACILMGIETTDPDTLRAIRKGSTTRQDHTAIELLRRHGILSMLGHVVGFEEETPRTYWRALRQIARYDPDLLNAMYLTPHGWSHWTRENGHRQVLQADLGKWDYRHQILSTRHLHPSLVFALVKLTEILVHCRPRSLRRLLRPRDKAQRPLLWWAVRRAALVWLAEVWDFVSATRFARRPMTLAAWFGDAVRAQSSSRALSAPAVRARSSSPEPLEPASPASALSAPCGPAPSRSAMRSSGRSGGSRDSAISRATSGTLSSTSAYVRAQPGEVS